MKKSDRRLRRREFMRQFFAGNMAAFVVSILQIFVFSAGELMISWLLQRLVDTAAGAQHRFTLPELCGLCFFCIIIFLFGICLSCISRPRFIAKAIGQYKEFVFKRLAKKRISAFAEENSSLYISALSNDSNTIETDFLANIFALINDVIMFVGAVALMLWYSPRLTLAGIVFAVLPVAASILAGNRLAEAEKNVSDKNESYISLLNDSLSGFSVIKSFKAEAAMCRLFSECIKKVNAAKTARRKTAILVQGMGMIAGTIAQVGVFVSGAVIAVNDKAISPGILVAFVNLMNWVVMPIGTIPQYVAQWKAAYALMDKLSDALEDGVRWDGQRNLTKLEEGIVLYDLSFGFEKERPVLESINFSFEAGKSYAIVGSSGSGKSTMLGLMMASYEDYTGSICYDGTELREICSESLYDVISYVQQNVFVFNASIKDNITMFSDFPEAEVERAIKLSGLSGIIKERGEGYMCGENGSGLSGGEKQRLAIARSLLKQSKVLLVDEATSSLDTQTAFQVSNSILDLDGLTRIVVTHALDESILKRYDCILVMKNGRIAECGKFSELMQRKGYFYSLYTVSQ